MYALSSVLAALLRRASTGLGAQLEVSMLEATGEWMGFHLWFAQGTGHAPDRMGLSTPRLPRTTRSPPPTGPT